SSYGLTPVGTNRRATGSPRRARPALPSGARPACSVSGPTATASPIVPRPSLTITPPSHRDEPSPEPDRTRPLPRPRPRTRTPTTCGDGADTPPPPVPSHT